MGKTSFDPNGGRCCGNGGRGGSIAGRGGGWLAKRSIVSNEGCGSGGLAVKMVSVAERSTVEGLFWECSRDESGRFLSTEQPIPPVPFAEWNRPSLMKGNGGLQNADMINVLSRMKEM
ncbi:hypothetical protein Tco_0386950 [Tanacetum coccineum]